MNILCIIVLYKCRLFDSVSYNKCAKKWIGDNHFKLFVYDNSPTAQHSREEMRSLGIEYVSDLSNPGVSKAYNCGAQYALKNSYSWLLLLDQDTIFQDDSYIERCFMAISSSSISLFVPEVLKKGNGVLSPLPMKHYIPRKGHYLTNNSYSLKNVSIINSGMLIRTKAFFDIGGYNEKVPLDLADYQFIDRFKRKYKEFYLLDYSLIQVFSNDVDDIEQHKRRFTSYCISSINYEANIVSKIEILAVMVKHCFSLIYKKRDPIFLHIMIKSILKR